MNYFNPYYEQNFWGFFGTFFVRLLQFFNGQIPLKNLASDEVQLIVLAGVAASSALVGCFLILRKMTMVANSISHTILLGIVLAYFFTGAGSNAIEGPHLNIEALLIASLFVGFFTFFLGEFLTKTTQLQEDASTGLVFTALFALGIILVTLLTRNAHIGAEVVMGNVDGLHIDDCKLVFGVLFLNILIFALFYKQFQLIAFDPGFAKAHGFSINGVNYLLMALVSATVVSAFRAVGVLMVLTFITGPPLTARLLTDSLKKMLWLSACLGILAAFLGVALSRHLLTTYGLALSTAGLVVAVVVAIYAVVLSFTLMNKRRRIKPCATL